MSQPISVQDKVRKYEKIIACTLEVLIAENWQKSL